jgi:hypothetical protein
MIERTEHTSISNPVQIKFSTDPCSLILVPQMHAQWRAEACLRAAQKTATLPPYRSLRFYQLAALVPSAGAILKVDLGLHCGRRRHSHGNARASGCVRTKEIFTKENTDE